jgi:peptide/nickel transport system substrate-binding protein
LIGGDRNPINHMNYSTIPTWRKWLAVVLAFVSAIALSGCNPTEFKTSAAQIPQIVFSATSEPQTFNYFLNQQSPSVFDLIYEGMLTQNGVTGELEPGIAQSWEVSEDNLKIVFTLREKLKWSDGEPLTVDDVIFTFNNILFNEAIPTDSRDIFRIGKKGVLPKVRKLDERRVEFTVPEPFAPFLLFAGGSAILPEHALRQSVTIKDKNGKPQFLSTWGTGTDPKRIISNGPYKLESYTPSQRVVFRRNPYYWRRDAQGKSLPYVDRLVWQTVENADTALIQFRAQGVDMLEIGAKTFRLLKREEKRGNFRIYNGGPSPNKMFIAFNLNKGSRNGRPLISPIKSRWFNTVAFRQAVAYAIDRQTMINNIFQGLGETQNSPISVQSPFYLSPKEGLKVYDYNLAKAKELLQKAGFKYNNKAQLLDADGNRVRFTLSVPSGGRTGGDVAAQLKRDLSKIGIQLDLQFIDFGVLGEKTSNTLDWESIFYGFTGGFEPYSGNNIWSPDGGLHLFNQKPQPGQAPIQGREVADWEAEIGRLYVQGTSELDEAKRKAIYAETQRLAQEYLPFIHLINPLSLAAIRNDIQGAKFSAIGGTLWNAYELKVTENK